MKAIIVARVSSKDQEDGQSIPAQVRRLTEYAAKKGLDVEHVFQITESSSKETRKEFSKIISYIKKSRQPTALVTDTVDRLQRSFRETPALDELRKQGILELHFLREGLVVDKESNSAKLLQWDIGVLFASSYVRQLSDNVKRSKEQCAREGQWTSKAPLGYKNVLLDSGKKGVTVDPRTSHYVKKMFELYATDTHSFSIVAREISKLGMRNSKGGKIAKSRVEVALKNPFYCGLMRIKGEIYPHKYERLISEHLFDRVQDIIGGHKKAPVQYAGKPILLRGLIKCNNCGCTVSGYIKKGKYTYYSCNNSKKICYKKIVNEKNLLEVLLGYFEKIQLPDNLINDVVEHLRKAFTTEQDFFKRSQEALRKELDLIQGRSSKLVDLHVDGVIDANTYNFKVAEYKRRQREITSEMASHVDADEACLITAKTVLGLAKRAKEIFMSSNVEEKRQLLSFVFTNLRLDHDKLLVELREPFNMIVNLSDRPKWCA